MILLLGWTDYDGPQLVGVYETLVLAEHYIKEHDPATPEEVPWHQAASGEPSNYYATPVKHDEFRYYWIKPDAPLAELP